MTSPQISYLLSLEAVRDRSRIVFSAAERDELTHFTYHPEKLDEVAEFVIGVIDRDFGPDNHHKIPPHGRWQHFEVGGVPRIDELIERLREKGCDDKEVARTLVDLFVVSVLLDAGAGDGWKFREGEGGVYSRSEGIAVASLSMFMEGVFNGEGGGMGVDAKGLQAVDEDALAKGFQITSENPMVGVGSRAQLLSRLGDSLLKNPEIFGAEGRPGNLVDYILNSTAPSNKISYSFFWSTLQKLLIPIWPSDRTQINNQPIGDAWPLSTLSRQASKDNDDQTSSIQPFHKLTQWLAYSLTTPFTKILSYTFENSELGTGLPEYRNGGLFIDLGLLGLKPEALARGKRNSGEMLPGFRDCSDEIVEWRAMTVALLDEVYGVIRERFGRKGVEISMAQMLEAGSWKAGREVAARMRPETKGSPILIQGDGTLF